ncbi:MAG: TaqI-like C-terminal specificity domain-containing protein, partial [Candidatus Jordarchaeaceae archaeon]
PLILELENLAKIKRGFTTGADAFFYLDEEKRKQWDIEKEFLKPVIVRPKDVRYFNLTDEDVKHYVLLVSKTKEELKGTNVLKYIEWGESVEVPGRGRAKGHVYKGYHNVMMIKPRKIWYDLGSQEPAPILFPRIIRWRTFFIWNLSGALAHQTFYNIYPYNQDYTLPLLGVLNSTLTQFFAELHGRLYGRGLLEFAVYELKKLPIIDIRALDNKQKGVIQTTFMKLCEAQRTGQKKLEEELRKVLDNAVFDVLGLSEDERRQVYEGLEALRRMRLQRKEVEILVETAEQWKPAKKPKKERIKRVEPSKRLDAWIDKS